MLNENEAFEIANRMQWMIERKLCFTLHCAYAYSVGVFS